MRAAVVGAETPKGRRIVRDLSEADFEITRLTLGDRPSATTLVIGCLNGSPAEELKAASLAIEAGAAYFSGSEDAEAIRLLLGLDEETRSSRTLVLAGCSWSPGLSGVLARLGAEALVSVRKVEVSWVVSGGRIAGATKPSRDEDEVYFPEPLGWRRVRPLDGPEILTLPGSLPGVEQVVVKGAVIDARADLLGRFGGRRRSIDSWSAVRIDVFGRHDEVEERVSLAAMDQLGNLESTPMLIAALLFARGEMSGRGARSLDAEVDPGKFVEHLAERGLRVARLHRHDL